MKEMIYKPKRQQEILYSDTYMGYKFAIISLGTHPVAYVECKLPNCDSYGDRRLDGIMVHYGFTYYRDAYWDKNDTTLYLGWDYAHYGDYAGYEVNFPTGLRIGGKKWTTEEIYNEVKSVIEQLNELT